MHDVRGCSVDSDVHDDIHVLAGLVMVNLHVAVRDCLYLSPLRVLAQIEYLTVPVRRKP